MSYFILCSFDLVDAKSEDYDNAYKELATLGLKRTITADGGKIITLPNTTTACIYNGSQTSTARDYFSSQIQSAFAHKGLKAKIFVSVGNDYAWGQRES